MLASRASLQIRWKEKRPDSTMVYQARRPLEPVLIPETKYAKSGRVHIAYQIFGEGPLPLVVGPGWASHIEYAWEEPSYARLLQRLGSFAHVAWVGQGGTGLSDRLAQLPTPEQRMDAITAGREAVGFERAAN